MGRRRRRQIIPVNVSPKIYIPFMLLSAFLSGYFLNESPKEVPLSYTSNEIRACFSPGGDCEDKIISFLDHAEKEILVQCYAFTSTPIADALLKAHKRGVSVKVLYDEKAAYSSHSKIKWLSENGIIVEPEQTKGLSHNKIILIDGEAHYPSMT